MSKTRSAAIAATVWAAAAAGWAQTATQGVSKDEILLGSIQDLSGPAAAFGKQIRAGLQLRIDEINEQGGIHGRKLRLVVEDSGYDPKKAVLAAQKLVNQDRIFAMVGHIGTAQNMAAMPVQFGKNVMNFYPMTAAREMYEPFHRLKFAFVTPYYDAMEDATPALAKQKGSTKPCVLYQDDEYGLEVMRGAEAGLKAAGMEFAVKTTYKRGATDFSSQVARLKSAGCDFVVLGTIIRETIGAIGEAHKSGYTPVFLGSGATYTDLIHKLGGKTMDGFYATMTVQHPYLDEASQPLRFWANKYKTKFGEDPGVFSAFGYAIADAFAVVAGRAGPQLTVDGFVKVMDSLTLAPDMFGNPPMKFSPTQRLGSDRSRLSQIQDGRWKVVADYAK